MRTYSELGRVHRTDPCVEYPGKWLVYFPGRQLQEENQFSTFEEAYAFAQTKDGYFSSDQLTEGRADVYVSIYWQCSDDDPRVGQVWFTGFYRHGHFDCFGNYKQ